LKTKTLLVLLLFMLAERGTSQHKTTAPPATVFVFLSESCPICQSYTLPLKELHKKYGKKNIRFIGVFPNDDVTEKDLEAFKITYSIPFELKLDSSGALTKKLNATVTPEVFVEDGDGNIIYSGRIDDSFYAVGKRRKVVTTHELADALASYVSNKAVRQPKTQAVGCIITTSNK
jgi:thiol-disulfide isomerase/thioredoxin